MNKKFSDNSQQQIVNFCPQKSVILSIFCFQFICAIVLESGGQWPEYSVLRCTLRRDINIIWY